VSHQPPRQAGTPPAQKWATPAIPAALPRPRPLAATRRQPARSRSRGNPRRRAALCYAVPFIPALSLLLRERRNRFLRLHAARALAFFGLLVIAQVGFFAALVAIGGLVPDGKVAVALGLAFYALAAVLGLAAFGMWLRLLADAAAGRYAPMPLLAGAAHHIERFFSRMLGLVEPAEQPRFPA
jgi:uncharacterized membrane protein